MSKANEAGWERAVRYAGIYRSSSVSRLVWERLFFNTAAEKPVKTCNSSYTNDLEGNSLTVLTKYELRT